MTHSEIVKLINNNADTIAQALKRGADVEIRIHGKLHSLKCYELRKYPLNGSESVQGVSSGFSGLDR